MKAAVAAFLLVLAGTLQATSLECEVDAECPGKRRYLLVPYPFYNEATGFAVAAAAIASGYPQPQVDLVGNIFAGTKDALAGFLFGRNYQLVEGGRWFLDVKLLAGSWAELKSYQPGNPAFPNERAGSNDSSEDNFVEAQGSDKFYRVNLRYVLPIGDGAKAPIHLYRTRRGLVEPETASGGREWNPWRSGRTTLELEPFYREQSFDNAPPGVLAERSTAGLTLRLQYDNTDWFKNPSHGSRTSVAASRDWGAVSDMPSWSQYEFEFAKYFALGETAAARQRVLAFVVWTSDVPTWNSATTIDGQPAFHRPPTYAGSTLGGLERQRGFEAQRFSDKAAINYQLEYRHIPVGNPLDGIALLEPLQIRWIQYVGFVELGRVADTWRPDTLHREMKASYGVGARAFSLGLVVRADLAFSAEGYQVQMFLGQTF